MEIPTIGNTAQNSKVLSDQELYSLAKLYGTNALMWRQKFIGLLPEVNRRRLYEKKGFGSIFEFSFKLAGLSEEQVKRAIGLDKKFENFPTLKALLQNGEVSMNKLARIAGIASKENESELATLVKVLPKSAVETFVRDEKTAKSVPGHESEPAKVDELNLTQEVTTRLMELKNKGIDLNQVLTELLDRREQEIEEEKAKMAEGQRLHATNNPAKQSRYIPARIRKLIKKEHGTKCSIAGCTRPAEEIHHTQMFALGQNHNPQFLAPLCKNHHKIAHSINLKIQEKRLVT